MKITSREALIKGYDKQQMRVKLEIARTTDDSKVMQKILNEGTPRELVHLAKNTNLSEDMEMALMDKAKDKPAIAESLIRRSTR